MATVDDITIALAPKVYYKLTESSGTAVADSITSPSQDNGAVIGTPKMNAPGMYAGETAIQLNGTSQYIKVTASPKLAAITANSPLSLSFFMQADAFMLGYAHMHGMVWMENSDAPDWWGLSFYSVGYLDDMQSPLTARYGFMPIYNYSDSRYVMASSGPDILQLGRWYHICVTQDAAGNATLYINGRRMQRNFNHLLSRIGATMDLYIGTHPNNGTDSTRNFSGRIARTAIFTTELTAANVQAIWSASAIEAWPTLNMIQHWQSPLMMSTHFDITQFNGGQGGTGTEPLSLFAPTEPTIDVNQWCSVAAAAGATTFSIVTKHQAGFCMWDTATTNHQIKNTPWGIANSYTDLIAEFVVACRKYGMSPGFYYSVKDLKVGVVTADNVNARWSDVVKPQLTELLTNYGFIANLVIDGAGSAYEVTATDPDLGAPGVADSMYTFIYRWVKRLSPNTLVFLNGGYYTMHNGDMLGYESNGPHLVFPGSVVTGSLANQDVVTQDGSMATGKIISTYAGFVKVVPLSGKFDRTGVIRKDASNYATINGIMEEPGAPAYSWRTSLALSISDAHQYFGGVWFYDPDYPAVTPTVYKAMLDAQSVRGKVLRWNLAPDNSGRIPADQLLPLQTYPVPSVRSLQLAADVAEVQAATWAGETHLGVAATGGVVAQIARLP